MSLPSDNVGYSVYYSQFERQRDALDALCRSGSKVFTSLHISEEADSTYVSGVKAMCAHLAERGYEIIADVSDKTLALFGETDITTFAKRMRIDMFRIDSGFSVSEVASIAERMPICINASTVSKHDAETIAKNAVQLLALHNFYPRPETALDEDSFDKKNESLKSLGITVAAFIPGDTILRGPLHEGLPTLERHRRAAPWAAFLDMRARHSIDTIFCGDGIMSRFEAACIDAYCTDGVVQLPVEFAKNAEWLYGSMFTIRVDSPVTLMRLAESREYAQPGQKIEVEHCTARPRGTVTIDNENYARYSGEIQIVKKDFPADRRVNVIGKVPENYALLLDAAPNGTKIQFVKAAD